MNSNSFFIIYILLLVICDLYNETRDGLDYLDWTAQKNKKIPTIIIIVYAFIYLFNFKYSVGFFFFCSCPSYRRFGVVEIFKIRMNPAVIDRNNLRSLN